MIKIVKVKFETKKGIRDGFYIKVLKGYVPITILPQLEHLKVIEEKDLEIDGINGLVKIK